MPVFADPKHSLRLPPHFLKRSALLLLLVVFTATIHAQNKYTVSGYIKDGESGESLIAATVIDAQSGKGATTNLYGFYSLTLAEGEHTLTFSYIGFEDQVQTIKLDADKRINIELGFSAVMTDQVVITGERRDKNVESTDMGKVELSTEEAKVLPALMGEVDVMKTLQLLPGIQSSGEGNSGFYVRGGGPDQNLILLDDAVVYNSGHLFGFFSVFNSDAVKNTTLIKGGMPANYGGRLSSVVDVQMSEGNMKKYQVTGGIGFIASRLTIQGPIVKDKASFIISGRRTYIDLITKPIFKNLDGGRFAGNSYYFYDLNVKVNYRFSDKDRLYASGYFGRDVFTFSDPDGSFKIDIPWGNATATLRWNHLFNDKLFMNTTAIFQDYKFGVESDFQGVAFELFSGVRDYSMKMDFDYFPHPNHKVKFGAIYTYHQFTPYTANGQSEDQSFGTDLDKKLAHEAAIYILDEWDIHERFKINFGLRGSMFSNVGPYDKKVLNEAGAVVDTIHYGYNENIATYGMLEPRLSMRFKVDEFSSIKAGFTVNRQYIHLVSSSSSTLPTDLWVPSTDRVKPQLGIQYSIGYFRNFLDNMFETSIELYYKDLRNQIEFGQSFVQELNTDIEEGYVFGKGWSYGAEFFVKKALGDFNGWIGYTLSFTNRKFPDINEGQTFVAKYDRRHDLSIVLIYDLNDRWKFATTFVYGTGQATTLPIGRYFVEGQIVNQYGERNSYRMEPYHRLDLSVTYVFKLKRKFYSDLAFSVYNVYNRQNPYFIYYDVDGSTASNDLTVSAKQASLFPVLPSITWNFKY